MSNDVIAAAIEKIKRETEEFNGDRYGKAIYKAVSTQLINFCEQESDFAEVVLKTKRTLSDCCAECMIGVTESLSDKETYERAVKFYYPDSDVQMVMTLVTGTAPDEDYINKEAEKRLETTGNTAKKSGEKEQNKAGTNTATESKKLSAAKEKRNKAIRDKKQTEGQVMIFDLI